MKGLIRIAFAILCFISLTIAQESNVTFTCASKSTCGECVQSPDCIWCAQQEFKNEAGLPLHRCIAQTVHQAQPESVRCDATFLGYVPVSPLCNNAGSSRCGECVCDDFHGGRFCECNIRQRAFIDDDRACKIDSTSDIVCQSRGTCTCGECVCDKRPEPERIYGKYCECDNFNCERDNGVLCSGEDHGRCDCGRCKCKVGWSGENCGCSTLTTGCYAPGKAEICSGKGDCECNRCKCHSTAWERYSGRYCNKCPTCPDRCDEFAACVQCTMFETGYYADEETCQKECVEKYPEIIKFNVAAADESLDENFCYQTDETDKCRFYYVYGYDRHDKLYIKAQRTKECPPSLWRGNGGDSIHQYFRLFLVWLVGLYWWD